MDEQEILQILKENHGFSDPAAWVDYGRAKGFRRVSASLIPVCPDCEGADARPLGQYVYYSSLMTLKECLQCGLIFSDARIDPSLIAAHFESTYKDEEYFTRRRKRIFEQIAGILSNCLPSGARVLDIGGAKGHLLAELRSRRPDLELFLNDISEDACKHASGRFELQTIPGRISEIPEEIECFDACLLIDVAYYEADIKLLWSRIKSLVKPGGVVVLRLPNRAFWLRSLAPHFFYKKEQTRIPGFNPEHISVFTRTYLSRRLRSLGFSHVEFSPAAGLITKQLPEPLVEGIFRLGRFLAALSSGRLIPASSFIVIAQKDKE